MESILATRKQDGPFQSLEDFCARVDLRLVNRRVVESLIKAGAFDSLGLPRAHLMAGVDAALETGQRQQREKSEGQASFFDLLPTPVVTPKAEPIAVVPEWDSDQRLEFEKEVLGFYISGHPLARYATMVESLGMTSTSEIAAKSAGARVLLFGQVASMKETSTKGGNRMAFVTLEDMAGTVEVTVFPEPFKAAAEYLRGRQPVIVRGRIDDADKGRVVLAEDVRPLEAALTADGGGAVKSSNEPNAVRVRIRPASDPQEAVAALKTICGNHPGPVPVFVHLLLAAQEVVVRTRGLAVDAAPELVAELNECFGAGAVTVDHA